MQNVWSDGGHTALEPLPGKEFRTPLQQLHGIQRPSKTTPKSARMR